MPKIVMNRLTVRTINSLRDGVYGDGGNLWLTIKGNTRAWSVRFKSPLTGKTREMGIGSVRHVSLADARRLAAEARQKIFDGCDPIEERKSQKATFKQERSLKFDDIASRYIQEQSPAWRDPRQSPIWTTSLQRYVFPIFGNKPVATITTEDVLNVLRPIWTTKTETAGRVRGRIERILDYAKTHGWREGENPAQWRGHLSNILPAPTKITKVEHHAAVDRRIMPRVMKCLITSNGLAAKAVQFLCLTAARSSEVRSATWNEIDLNAKIWTVPGERMKAGREHRVPLCDGTLAILKAVLPLRDTQNGNYIFPGQKIGKSLSDVALSKALHTAAGTKNVTVHGLRSTFRDWAAEETDFPREVAEMALAHTIGDKVEAAYRRGDLFEKRRLLMQEWCQYVTGSKLQK
ncbi:phage integrase central domain-containing protein [Gluconobacter cerinus]|uniref:tyrosine-type recombinase/integrase n=1 Tax=Gluconobacter cerinus TaxID=38307 RepID=UPI001B8B37F3|nr:integrase arm-type DNA-binding domain-containing protein [Gluconobacter cerinus]MBS0984239.1 tyrosine-type recombinase/integrase [Gluconobacter cerinus]